MTTNLLTVREAAEQIGCSPESVRRYINQGILNAEKVGSQWLVEEHDLADLVEDLESDEQDDFDSGDEDDLEDD